MAVSGFAVEYFELRRVPTVEAGPRISDPQEVVRP